MTEVAGFTVSVPRWRRLLRRREHAPRVDFAELVWHHHHWRAALADSTLSRDLDERYRAALERFESEHGRVVNAYWCYDEPSAAVLTVRPSRLLARLLRRPPRFRFHRVSDWTTKNRADVAELLHECDALAVRTSEILRGTTQRITMELIVASAAQALALADPRTAHEDAAQRQSALGHARGVLERTKRYYHEVALREAQIVYFWGMMAGFLVVAAVAAAGVGSFVNGAADARLAYVTILAGAMGAIVSVLMRVTKNTFVVDADLGRPSLRRLGSFRPVIGAVSGLFVYLAFRSGVLTVQPAAQDADAAHYFFALLAFLAGFSERFAKDVLDAARSTIGAAVDRHGESDEPEPEPAPRLERPRSLPAPHPPPAPAQQKPPDPGW